MKYKTRNVWKLAQVLCDLVPQETETPRHGARGRRDSVKDLAFGPVPQAASGHPCVSFLQKSAIDRLREGTLPLSTSPGLEGETRRPEERHE